MTPPEIDRARWFSEEVLPHGAQLKAYLRGSFPAVRDVEDVVQESYLRLWKARATQSVLSAKGFLFRIARCIAVDTTRRARAAPFDSVADISLVCGADVAPNAAEMACTEDELRLLAAALAALPPRCREIVELRKLQRVSQKEIAARLGISEQTVQAQVFLGVKRCGQYLVAHGIASSREHGR